MQKSIQEFFLNRKALPRNSRGVLLFLFINIFLYGIVFVVRTQQAYLRFGENIDIYPITRSMRGLISTIPSDELRWISYLLLLLISLNYIGVALRAFRLGKILDQNQEKGMFIVWAIVPYIVLGITSILLYPHVSVPVDTVDYAVHARIQTIYQENPYETPGIAHISQEPLVRYMEGKSRPSVYGPLWQLISLLPATVGNGGVVSSIMAFKVFFWGVGLVALFLIRRFHLSPNNHSNDQLLPSAVLVAWNPLLHLVSHGDGHNDILMAIFLVGMIVALNFQRPLLGFLNYGLSALVKFISAPILFPLVIYSLRSDDKRMRSAKIRLILIGLTGIGLLILLATSPFGVSAMLSGISGRYGGLVTSAGTSKVSLVAGIVHGIASKMGIIISYATLTSLVGFAFPLSWVAYVLLRSLSLRSLNDVTKIVLEAYLFYVTFVALPAYAQYVITPAVLVGLLVTGNWHRAAVAVASLAFLWDQFFIVYLPQSPLVWESYFHQISHLLVIVVILIYFTQRSFDKVSSAF